MYSYCCCYIIPARGLSIVVVPEHFQNDVSQMFRDHRLQTTDKYSPPPPPSRAPMARDMPNGTLLSCAGFRARPFGIVDLTQSNVLFSRSGRFLRLRVFGSSFFLGLHTTGTRRGASARDLLPGRGTRRRRRVFPAIDGKGSYAIWIGMGWKPYQGIQNKRPFLFS